MWIYLFFLPFQLIDLFGWYAVPGVTIAAFIYLGLVAAGEEIEQPFGASSAVSLLSSRSSCSSLPVPLLLRL